MKKSIVIFLGLFYSIASFAQYEAGDYVNADTFKLNNTEVYLKHLYLGNEVNRGKVPKNFVDSIGWVSPDSIQDLKLEFDNDTLRISLRTVLQDKESFVKMSVSTVNHIQYKINDLRISNDTLYLVQGDTVLIANINNVWVQDSSEVKAQLRDWLYSVARTISSGDKTTWNNSFMAVTSPFYIPGSTQGIEYYFRNRANQTVGTITLVPANMLYPGLMTSAQYQLVRDWENSVAYNIDAGDTARWGVKYWSLEPDSINLLPLDTVGNSVFRLNLKQTGARFQSDGPQLHLDYNDSTYSAVITDSAGVLNLVPSGGIVATSGHINLEGGIYQRGKHYMIEPFLYGNPGDPGTVPVSQGPNLPPVWGPASSGSGSMVYPSTPGLVKFNGTTWASSITDNSNNWNAAYNDRITSAAVTGTGTKTITLNQQDGGTVTANFTDVGISTYPGAGIPTSTGSAWGTSITNNSANWNTAYNDRITSAAVTGTGTKTITLNQQDGGTVTASFTDETGTIYPGAGLVKSTGTGWDTPVTDNSANWNVAYNDRITSAAVTGTGTKTITLNQQDGGTVTANFTDVGISTYPGAGIPTSTGSAWGTSITNNSANWNTAYNDRITSAAVTGTGTKTITLNQQDGGTVTASFTDETGTIYPGAGIPTSTGSAWGTSITNNSANWNTAYNDRITSAAVTGTGTKTITLNQQDGGTVTASFTDETGTIYPGAGIPTSTGSAWGTSITNNSSYWNAAYNDRITSAAVTGTDTKTITLNQQDGGTVTASFIDKSSGTGSSSPGQILYNDNGTINGLPTLSVSSTGGLKLGYSGAINRLAYTNAASYTQTGSFAPKGGVWETHLRNSTAANIGLNKIGFPLGINELYLGELIFSIYNHRTGTYAIIRYHCCFKGYSNTTLTEIERTRSYMFDPSISLSYTVNNVIITVNNDDYLGTDDISYSAEFRGTLFSF